MKRIAFKSLRTKLTVLYAALFGLAALLTAFAVVTAVTGSARKVLRDELAATGAVYEQVWALRSDQLRQGAAILAQDFGFREAFATADEATVRSALDNLRARQGVDAALIIGADGSVIAVGDTAMDTASIDALWSALDTGKADSGVIMVKGQPHQAVAAPILAPVLIGWIVFAQRLDEAQMRELESLSAIPLSARVLSRSDDGWRGLGAGDGAISARLDRAVTQTINLPATLDTEQGRSMVLAQALPSFDAQTPATLLLTYPLATAMKPYNGLFATLGAIALGGLALMVGGSGLLARGLTRPITALDRAVRRLQTGEHVEVTVHGADEIGRLADSFNAMAGDIRDREARLIHMALHDPETGLPNRAALEDQARLGSDGYVIVFGIERFEVVRNAIGYDAMAQLVAALAARLSALADGAPIARVATGALGLTLAAADDAEALTTAQRLCEASAAPVQVNGEPIDIGVSAGLATIIDDSVVASPVDRAAIAMDQARLAHRPAALFDGDLYGDPAGNLSLISELMAALRDGDVALHYQPKYDLRADAIVGVEALARWTHPRRGAVSPDLFIGMAEETGHIRPFTDWALGRVIADQKAMRAAGHDVQVSINISGRLLGDAAFADIALAAISANGSRLCFEITETAVIENPQVALAVIDRLVEAGVSVSIDDYGSGLSSLNYLKQIRADELKIDKAFVLSLDETSRDALLVKSTIDLAHSLGMKVVAEGVETGAALSLLRGMGCDMAQGYFIARAMPLPVLLERLDQSTKLTAPAGKRRAAAVRVA